MNGHSRQTRMISFDRHLQRWMAFEHFVEQLRLAVHVEQTNSSDDAVDDFL